MAADQLAVDQALPVLQEFFRAAPSELTVIVTCKEEGDDDGEDNDEEQRLLIGRS